LNLFLSLRYLQTHSDDVVEYTPLGQFSEIESVGRKIEIEMKENSQSEEEEKWMEKREEKEKEREEERERGGNSSLRALRVAVDKMTPEFWLACLLNVLTVGTVWPFIALSPEFWASKWGECVLSYLLSLSQFRS
jgi:hypothetical protein